MPGKSAEREKKTGNSGEMFINADNCIAGRVASCAAKMLMGGKRVYIANAEKAVISGKPEVILETYKKKRRRGDPYHGPFYPKRPEDILRRIVRGMVPRREPKGRNAMRRLRVFMSVPEEFKDSDFETIEKTKNKLVHKYVTLEKISRGLGAKLE